MQLKRIHGSQEAVLDSSQAQKEKREQIREIKEEIQKLNANVRHINNKAREKQKKVNDRHESVIEVQERCRNMQEVLRLKKIEEKAEIDNQIEQGILEVGSIRSPMGKRNKSRLADNMSERSHYTKVSLLNQIPNLTSPKIKADQITQLEKQCQRMIFEKEDKYLENEAKLKNEDA